MFLYPKNTIYGELMINIHKFMFDIIIYFINLRFSLLNDVILHFSNFLTFYCNLLCIYNTHISLCHSMQSLLR